MLGTSLSAVCCLSEISARTRWAVKSAERRNVPFANSLLIGMRSVRKVPFNNPTFEPLDFTIVLPCERAELMTTSMLSTSSTPESVLVRPGKLKLGNVREPGTTRPLPVIWLTRPAGDRPSPAKSSCKLRSPSIAPLPSVVCNRSASEIVASRFPATFSRGPDFSALIDIENGLSGLALPATPTVTESLSMRSITVRALANVRPGMTATRAALIESELFIQFRRDASNVVEEPVESASVGIIKLDASQPRSRFWILSFASTSGAFKSPARVASPVTVLSGIVALRFARRTLLPDNTASVLTENLRSICTSMRGQRCRQQRPGK